MQENVFRRETKEDRKRTLMLCPRMLLPIVERIGVEVPKLSALGFSVFERRLSWCVEKLM